jgi:transcriptional regulator with XRE-family HTH domain
MTRACCASDPDMPPSPPNRLTELRKARGWSMAQLGARCIPQVDGSQINKLEKGATELSPKWLRILSAALECSPVEVLPNDLRDAVINFRHVLEATEPSGGDPVPPTGSTTGPSADEPTAEEWEIIRQYRQAAETTRETVRTALAEKKTEPPVDEPMPATSAMMFEFKAEHDGTYRFKTFWPPNMIIKSDP